MLAARRQRATKTSKHAVWRYDAPAAIYGRTVLIRAIDIKTTGIDPARDEIVEIASVDMALGSGFLLVDSGR